MTNIEQARFIPRQIASTVTTEMQQLINSRSFNPTAETSTGLLCNNGAINIVGALLVSRNADRYLRVMKDAKCEPGENIINPIDITPSVAIVASPLVNGVSIHKNVCGHTNAGVILTGPLSGLLISEGKPVQSQENHPSVLPIRIFNDNIIPSDPANLHPYYPYFIKKRDNGIFPPGEIELLNEMYKMFKIDYIEFVQSVRKKLGKFEVSVREVLFELCRELQIPVDEQLFHYTLPVGELEN